MIRFFSLRMSLNKTICALIFFSMGSHAVASDFPAQVFDEIHSIKTALNLVTAAQGNDQFESEVRIFLKQNNIDIARPFVPMDYDGLKIKFEGLSSPLSLGLSSTDFIFKKVKFTYDTQKSVKANFNKMKKVWGHFKELNLNRPGHKHYEKLLESSGVLIFASLAVTVALAKKCVAVSSYFGYKWFKNTTDPLKLDCKANKIVQSKGRDRLVVEIQSDGRQSFYSEVDGRRELQGDLEKISLHGKESYAIANGNSTVNELRTSASLELYRKLLFMKNLCANPEELASFNLSARHIQEVLKSGKVKLEPKSLLTLDAVEGTPSTL